MSFINRRTGVFERTAKVWAGAVGANTSLVDPVTGECARAIIVATGGNLVVLEAGAVARTYTAADIVAAQGFLRGNFEQVTAVGSTAFDLTVGW